MAGVWTSWVMSLSARFSFFMEFAKEEIRCAQKSDALVVSDCPSRGGLAGMCSHFVEFSWRPLSWSALGKPRKEGLCVLVDPPTVPSLKKKAVRSKSAEKWA